MGRNKGHHAPAGQIEVSAHIFRPIQCQQSQWIKSKARCEAGKEGECESNYKVSKTCSSLSLHLNIVIFYSQPPITSTQVSAQASYMVYSQQNSLALPQTLSLAPLTNHFIPTQQQYSITPYTSHPPQHTTTLTCNRIWICLLLIKPDTHLYLPLPQNNHTTILPTTSPYTLLPPTLLLPIHHHHIPNHTIPYSLIIDLSPEHWLPWYHPHLHPLLITTIQPYNHST